MIVQLSMPKQNSTGTDIVATVQYTVYISTLQFSRTAIYVLKYKNKDINIVKIKYFEFVYSKKAHI